MIRLETFDKGSYAQLIAWIASAEALMLCAGPGFTFPLTAEQLDLSLSDPNRFSFKVTDAASYEMIGHAEIYAGRDTAWLGRILIGDAKQRGKGIGLQIVDKLLAIAFGNMQHPRVQLNVFDWNSAAIKCYERAGFTADPTKKTKRIVNGQTWYAINMYIDKTTWECRQHPAPGRPA